MQSSIEDDRRSHDAELAPEPTVLPAKVQRRRATPGPVATADTTIYGPRRPFAAAASPRLFSRRRICFCVFVSLDIGGRCTARRRCAAGAGAPCSGRATVR